MATGSVSPKKNKVVDIPGIPTIGAVTDLALSGQVTVAFTAPSGAGGPAYSYTTISTPGSITGTGTSSPITVTGLTDNTSYTFKVAAVNATGTGEYSSASSAVTPTAPAGSFEPIATVTVGSGGSSSVTFSSIPGTYTHLQIRGIHRADNGGGTSVNGYIQFNSDTGSNYSWHVLAGDSDAASAGALTSTSTPYAIRAEGTGGIANSFGASITDILDYANTNKYKTVRTITGSQNNGSGYGAGFINLNSVLWMSTSAITSISLYVSGGPATWQQYSSFALYGIKGS